MKKTLITLSLMAATSVAMGDFVYKGDAKTIDFGGAEWCNRDNWELTGETAWGTAPAADGTGPAMTNSDAWDKMVFSGVTVNAGSATAEGWAVGIDARDGSSITLNMLKFQNGANISVDASSSVALTAGVNRNNPNMGGANTVVTAGAFSFSMDPNANAAYGDATWNLTITGNGSANIAYGNVTSLTLSDITIDTTESLDGGLVKYTAVLGDFTLGSNASITFEGYTLAESSDSLAAGEFYISEVSGNQVLTYVTPEPTTATLSLLALAGLCARRRRK